MINISIERNGVPSLKHIRLGNQFENNDESIQFELPAEFDLYNKYVIAVHKATDTTRVLPIADNTLIVSSQLTWLDGTWNLYVYCKENALDLESETVDITTEENEHVFISDVIMGTVKAVADKSQIDNMPLDSNLQIVYERLEAMAEEWQKAIDSLPNANERYY